MSALVRGSQCLQSTRNMSLDPLDDTHSHVTVTGYILHYSVTLVLRLARLSIPGRLAEVSLQLWITAENSPMQISLIKPKNYMTCNVNTVHIYLGNTICNDILNFPGTLEIFPYKRTPQNTPRKIPLGARFC